MKRFKQYIFTLLLSLLTFCFVDVKAQEVIVSNIDDYYNALSNEITTDTTIKLNSDICLEDLTNTFQSKVTGAKLTIDLNGHVLYIKSSNKRFDFAVSDKSTITFKDSSFFNTGRVDATSYFGTSMEVLGDASVNTINFENLKYFCSSSSNDLLFWTYKLGDTGRFNINIRNSHIKNTNGHIRMDKVENYTKFNINIESSIIEVSDGSYYNAYIDLMSLASGSTLKYKDVIDGSKYKILGTKRNSTTVEEIDLESLVGYANYKKFEIVYRENFEVSDSSFNTVDYGYSDVTEKTISIKATGGNKTIKKVTVSEPDKFIVTGVGTPTIVNGTVNTDFKIKPKKNLAVGTHTAYLTVIDSDDNKFTSRVVFVVNKAKINKPTINDSSKTYVYDGKEKKLNIVGYNTNAMDVRGDISGTDAGEYSVIVSISNKDNYSWSDDTTDDILFKWEIERADLKSFSVSIDDWTVKGTKSKPSVSGNKGGATPTYEYKVKGADDSTYTTKVPTEIGEYTIRATVKKTANYNGATATADFSIKEEEVFSNPHTYDRGISSYIVLGIISIISIVICDYLVKRRIFN